MGRALNPRTGIIIRRGIHLETQTNKAEGHVKREAETRVIQPRPRSTRDGGHSHGAPRMGATHPQKIGERHGQGLPSELPEGTNSAHALASTSGLCNCEAINFCCFP